ncbi:hypothetical protein [Stenomitos frigidus]|uniref:Uncharacterized protein n=1 Tax=Stenomitos frigidus ULC18 TaxID=2107698 RepID=A0A2T1EIZ4_9CYAN|nr:hypothetical protein [Stenomitos frigidus]PSB32648.1 hypothetical protein C7B82_05205 [Stenomitos frigidus ULC18]
MTDSQHSEDYASVNERSLKRLVRAITLSQGRFSLNFVRCNYVELQAEMQQRLQAACGFEVRYLTLPPSSRTLFTAIKATLGDEQPLALMVSGFESVAALDNLLVATNQVRDNFRKSFAFALVLWIDDEVLKKLMRSAPDFSSWAGVPIQFAITTEALIALLTKETDALFENAMEVGAGRFPRSSALYPEIGAHSRGQLKLALKELHDRGQVPPPNLAASLQFVLGQAAYADGQMLEARDLYEQSLAFWEQETTTLDANQRLERLGCLLFYLGLWWRRWAVLHRAEQLAAWHKARDYFQQCVQVLQAGDRPDLAAKFINALGEVLRRLVKLDHIWEELESVAQTSVALHKTYGDPLRLAYSYGLLAEVALSKADWSKAKQYADLALETNNRLPEPTLEAQQQYAERSWMRQHYRSLYLLLLAQAQRHTDSMQHAVETLERAKADCNHAYDPLLYIRILETLRNIYYQQLRYVEAFQTKRDQQSIEQQYSLRAFIGAVRLQPERQVINPALVPIALPESKAGSNHPDEPPPQAVAVAQEILASGRYRDVEKLIKRLSEPRYNLTIIHGPSGVGKSSIIGAGLIPALKQNPIGDRSALPVVLRVYKDWIKELGKSLTASLREKGIRDTAPSLENTSDIQVLLAQLRDNADRRSLLTVLVFDQFEEFFFANLKLSDRRPFLEFLHQCLNHLPFVKIVLSLREDHLHYLLEGSRLYADDITDNILSRDKRYPLGNFSLKDAKEIIEQLTLRSEFHLEPDLINQLVNDLSADQQEVRPIELQVVGAQLQESDITTLQSYQALGLFPKEKLVERFLEQVVKDCGPENKQTATLVLYVLTDDKGTRPLKTQPELIANLQAWELSASADQIDLVLAILVMSGLVLEIPEVPVKRYQLVHDYLATLVRQKLNQEVEDYKFKQQLDKARESDKARERLEADARSRQLRRQVMISAGFVAVPLLGLVLFLVTDFILQRNKAAIAEIDATNALSSSQLSSNNQLEALTNGIRAVTQLQKQQAQPGAVLLDLNQVRNRTIGNVFAAVYSIQEHDYLIGHRLWVASVSFSPNTKLFASASADNTIRLWTQNGKPLKTLEGHESGVNSVSFSPDGQRLASASDDKTIKLWDVQGNLLTTLSGHAFPVTSVSFSPDAQRLVSTSDDFTAKLWDIRTNRAIKTLKGHTDRVKAVSISADGTIATASWDGTVRLWSRDGIELKRFSNDLVRLCDASKARVRLGDELNQIGVNLEHLCREGNTKFTSVSFSPDGKTIAAGNWDTTVKVWNRAGTLLQTLTGHSDRVTSVAFSPSGAVIVSASNDGTMKLWDSTTGIMRRTLKVPGVISASFMDDNTLVSAGADGAVKLWKLDGIAPATLAYETAVTSISFSPDGQWLASASKRFEQDPSVLTTIKNLKLNAAGARALVDGQIKLWSLDGKRTVFSFPSTGNFASVKFNPDPQRHMLASAENSLDRNGRLLKAQVKLWSLDGKQLKQIGAEGEISDLSFSPNGQQLAIAENTLSGSASKQGKVKLWNLDRHTSKVLVVNNNKVNSVSISIEGIITTASDDSTIKLWQQDGQLLNTLKGHTDIVNHVSFSPDGKTLASASTDTTIRLWNLNGQLLQTLTGNSGSVLSANFSADGKLLVSGSDDGKIKLWSVTDGSLLAMLQKSDRPIYSVNFSPQNYRLIASAGSDNKVSLWQFELNSLITSGCSWLKPYLKTVQTAQNEHLCPS